MDTEKTIAAIDKVLYQAKGDSFDMVDVLYQIIIQSDIDIQRIAFQHVCELFGSVESSENFGISPSQYQLNKDSLKEQYGEYVDSLLAMFIKQNLENEEFYSKLWQAITNSVVFDNDEKRIFAFYYILIDVRIPYFHLDPASLYSISNERFKLIRQKYVTAEQKIRFILKADFSQKTEQASALLAEFGINIPDENADSSLIDDYEKMIVQMTQVIENCKSDRLRTLLDLIS